MFGKRRVVNGDPLNGSNLEMMSDWLVGSVAISLGILGFCAAATRAEWPLRWSLARALDKVAGRTAMRLGYIAGGAAMVAIGLAILRKHLGWW